MSTVWIEKNDGKQCGLRRKTMSTVWIKRNSDGNTVKIEIMGVRVKNKFPTLTTHKYPVYYFGSSMVVAIA